MRSAEAGPSKSRVAMPRLMPNVHSATVSAPITNGTAASARRAAPRGAISAAAANTSASAVFGRTSTGPRKPRCSGGTPAAQPVSTRMLTVRTTNVQTAATLDAAREMGSVSFWNIWTSAPFQRAAARIY